MEFSKILLHLAIGIIFQMNHSLDWSQAEYLEKKRLSARQERMQQRRLRSSSSSTEHGGQRIETWISYTGHRDQIRDDDDDDITTLSDTEVFVEVVCIVGVRCKHCSQIGYTSLSRFV